MNEVIYALEEAIHLLPFLYGYYPITLAMAYQFGIVGVSLVLIYFLIAFLLFRKTENLQLRGVLIIVGVMPGGYAIGAFSAGPWILMLGGSIYQGDLHNIVMNLLFLISNVCLVAASYFIYVKLRKQKNV